MSQKRKWSPEPPPEAADSQNVFRSAPIEDRSSTFTGYYSPSIPAKQLQSLPEFKDASHKILAWRKESNQRSLTGVKTQYTAGHDDDGEKYGGKRVEKVLEAMNVAGTCVVARWYGGVLLGPVRFTHIEDCARGAVQKWQESEGEERSKRLRLEEEAIGKGKLVKALSERDQSIIVLRTLAAEKEKQVKEAITAGVEALDPDGTKAETSSLVASVTGHQDASSQDQTNPKPAVDYSGMSFDRLRALDRARDATLAFLLKRIDRAEADLVALNDPQKLP